MFGVSRKWDDPFNSCLASENVKKSTVNWIQISNQQDMTLDEKIAEIPRSTKLFIFHIRS